MKPNDIQKAFNRRRFLGGSAVALWLPFMESLVPREARAQAGPAKRLIFYWVPNGLYMQKFRPTTLGADYAPTSILTPLMGLKSDFSIVSGLENANAKPDGVGDHAAGTCAFITCAHANKSATVIKLGVSADQLAAAKIGMLTKMPSLQLGTDGGGTAGDCDSGYSCAYARNVSWSGEVTPLAKLTDPMVAFNQIFMSFDPNASAADVAKRQAYSKSVLDSVTADANSLLPKLGRVDAQKLQQYLTGVRELERRVTDTVAPMCSATNRPAAAATYQLKVPVMNDIMVMALQCDVTRIVTFMLGNAVSNQTHPFLMANGAAITRGHHDISHHGNNAANLEMLHQIDIWEMTQLADLFTKMKKVTEGDANLLYNSTVFVSSDISDGNRHNHDDMPIILAGNGGGALHPGRHIWFPKADSPAITAGPTPAVAPAAPREKVANLLLSVIGTVGATGTLGDGTAPLQGL